MSDETTPLINLTIDGQAVSVPKGTTIYTAALKLGIDIPVFCYLDRMPPFGACRMCLVEVEKFPKLQTSCTLEVKEGMVVKTQSTMALEGREGVLEYLLLNHPLDCPVCDKGGECPLQDHTMKWGPGKSRFYEEKRHFKKPYPLGPVLMLDRERCIVCARCTRFGDVIAGDHALEFIDRGYKTEVGTPDGGPAQSKFIGNTIKICPVGALTSRVYRFRARPWDNQTTASTCTLCPVGCSLLFNTRDGEIMRTLSLENRDVNDIWLCDKGWFGYEFSNPTDRLQSPLIRRNGKLESASWEEALTVIAAKIAEARPKGKLAGLGGNPLTTEENFLFQQLMRQGAGVNNVDSRVGTNLVSINQEGVSPGMQISIGDCENLSYVFLLGIDLTESFPLIWLRLKQAINKGATVIYSGHYTTEIANHLSQNFIHAPGSELETLNQIFPQIEALAKKGQGAIFIGSQYLSSPLRGSILSKLIETKGSYSNLSLNFLEGNGNSMGARFAGMRPDSGPLGVAINQPGLNTAEVLDVAAREGWDFLYVVGANLASKCPSEQWKKVREKLGFLVVQDLFLTETAEQADVVLPTLCFIEKNGSFVNIEGRVQGIQQGKALPEGIYSDGDIFKLLAKKLNFELAVESKFMDQLKVGRLTFPELPKTKMESIHQQELTQGQLRATFAPELFDQGVRMRHNPHLIQLAKEPRVRMNRKESTKQGIQAGDRIMIRANKCEIAAKVKVDDGVADNTIVLPLGFAQIPVHEFGISPLNGLIVEVVKQSLE